MCEIRYLDLSVHSCGCSVLELVPLETMITEAERSEAAFTRIIIKISMYISLPRYLITLMVLN